MTLLDERHSEWVKLDTKTLIANFSNSGNPYNGSLLEKGWDSNVEVRVSLEPNGNGTVAPSNRINFMCCGV